MTSPMDLISGPSKSQHQFVGDAVVTYPLTHSQEGIWVDYLADRTSTQYNLTLEWDLSSGAESQVGVNEVVTAIQELTQRHSILRSTIALLNGKPHVWEHSQKTAALAVRLLSTSGQSISRRLLHKALHEPFDLQNEFPVRWYAVQQSSGSVGLIYLVAHHIALDGGSLTKLSVELLDLLAGNPPAVNQPSEKFSQAHLVERAWAHTEAYQIAEATCLDQLINTHLFRWPTTPQQGARNFRHLSSWATFSKDDLKGWSSRFSTSWFRVGVSLVGVLLHVYTSSPLDSDHALAVSFGGRPEGFEHTAGQFANPLPVKIPIQEHFLASSGSEKNTLASLVASVSRNLSRVKKAERVSMLDLSRRWHTKDRLGEFPAPQVAVSFSPAYPDERCRLFPVEGSWDLFFVYQDSPQGVELGVVYDPEIFNDAEMKKMQSTYMQLVELSKSAGTVTLNEVPTMPKHLAIPPAETPDTFMAVHDMFRRHAMSNPERIALSCAEKNHDMTYGELDDSSTLRAQVLASHGIAADSIVILHLQRGFHLLEWILATLKAGGAYVYLDPKLPSDRKKSILRIASTPTSILVTEDLLAQDSHWAEAFTGTIISPLPTMVPTSLPSPEQAIRQVVPENLAYMIFTSGSTGEPKAVMIEHGSFAHFVKSSAPVYRTGHGSRVLQLASFNFDASILEWSSALSTGATLCFADYPQALVGDYLADVIEKNAISFMQVTPTALATVPLQRQLSSLRRISIGGEAVSAHILETWRERVAIVNSYGPTEASIAVAFQNYTKGGSPIQEVTAGKPPKGTDIYICDASFTKVLPHGVDGEVCIGGKSLARGYYKKPDLTEEKFAIHPTLGVRLYRSGDRGMLQSDGSLVIHGRMDREIKMRGYRIAPEEVEKAISAADPAVTGASVQVSPDGLALVAVVTPGSCNTEALKQKMGKTMPSHMCPSTILPVPTLPLNSSGKIDHKTIKERMASYMSGGDKKMEQKTSKSKVSSRGNQKQLRRDVEVQKFVSDAWKEEIGLSEITSTSVNFFDMGGHSHLVPRLKNRITSVYPSCNVTTLDLFQHSTIDSQAKLLCQRLHSTDDQVDAEEEPETDTSFTAKENIGENAQQPNSEDLTEEERSIAVVGLAGKFPGADSPDDLYVNLTRGISGIRDSTALSNASVPKGCIWVPRAGTLAGIEEFDAQFWNLTREEAADMDPQQRLFLAATLQALEDAGLDNGTTFADASGSNRVGVFVGAATNQYHTVTEPAYGDAFQRANRGFVAPCLSARTAYHLNLHGPNVTVNTNCASSTVALGLAIDALRNHRCDVAVVGGVSVQLFSGGYVTQPNSIFSATGHCRPFEEAADGTVPSDAVVSVVLKRTADAIRNGDGMYAQITGAAYNSDGATGKAGYQVPSPHGQSDVIAAAWKNTGGLSPEKLQYIELHGSGTPIGDALELEAIKKGLAKIGFAGRACLVGSNKGSLGNTQHASGLVSLAKMCKSIQTGTIPAMARTGELNPLIADAESSTLLRFAYQPTRVEPEALIGISAAGWGGVNSHVVLRAPPAHLIKRLGQRVSKYTMCNETLAAPRKVGFEGLAISSLTTTAAATGLDLGVQEAHKPALIAARQPNLEGMTSSSSHGAATGLDLVIQEVHRILDEGHAVDAGTDLRALGLDSVQFVRLSQGIRNHGQGLILPVSSFIQPLLTPATLAARLESGRPARFPPTPPEDESVPWTSNKGSSSSPSPLWIQLQEGDQSSDRLFVLLPPSGGTCVSLAALVSSMPSQIPIYGLEHPGNISSLWNEGSYSVPNLAQLYADAVRSHLKTVGEKQVTFIGASFGGVVATEMLQILASAAAASDRATGLRETKLVLLDAPAAGIPAAASGRRSKASNGLDLALPGEANAGSEDEYEAISSVYSTATTDEGVEKPEDHHQAATDDDDAAAVATPTAAVHRANILALQNYSGPESITLSVAPADLQVLYVCARAAGPFDASRLEKKGWWTRIFPSLRWEELECGHEELWQAKAVDVLNLVQRWAQRD